MKITGQFRDINNNIYTVEIDNPSVSAADIIIGEHYNEGDDDDLLYFTDEPVTIDFEYDDLFTVIGMHSATINLYARDFVGHLLYANNARSVTVLIKKGNEVIFDGYVEAGTFNQEYSNPYDSFTINCVDKLSTLKYYKYKDITVDNFDNILTGLGNITMHDAINLAFADIIGSGHIYYDMSKGLSSTRENLVFDDIKVSEQIFVGDDYDSVMDNEQMITELLRYLNLHIIQIGSDFYIYDWDSIKKQNTQWVNLIDNEIHNTTPTKVVLNADTNASDGTNVSIDEVYNQVSVTCELNDQKTLIESPLDSGSLTSVFKNRQLYMTELISEGEGTSAFKAMRNMVLGQATDYEECKKVDWYLQWLESKNWKLYTSNGEQKTLYEQDSNGVYYKQYKISERLKQNYIEPAILSMGSVERQAGLVTDDSPITKLSMSNYIYISLNGNESRDESTYMPNDSIIQSRSPIAEYLGANSGGVFSPTDDDTTNYLVFSGKMCFMPIQKETEKWATMRELAKDDYNWYIALWHKTVPSQNNGDGRYYTRKFYQIEYPNGDYKNAPVTSIGIHPMTQDKSNSMLEFKYSEDWEWADKRSNLDVLECELIIGNKRLIERSIENSDKSKLQWVKLGEEPWATYDGQSYQITTFKLGINPKIGDKIIGDEFDIKSNMDFSANIDGGGFAVPIKKSDGVSGKVIFRVLGVVNTTWDEVTRRHPSFWRHTKWSHTLYFVLAQAESLIIKDFKVELQTDAAGYNTEFKNSDKDLVYISSETHDFVNKKDDITFKIITQPTTEEAIRIGCSTAANFNAATNNSTGLPISKIYNDRTRETYKAEEEYVSQYYQEYNKPKIILETEVWDKPNINCFNIYKYNALNRDFITMGMSKDLVNNKITLKLREK